MMGKKISHVASLLQSGQLVAFPTETVYGLGADATNDAAVAAIYEAKGRPSFNPLIVHVASAKQAAQFVQFTPLAQKLTESFWPGPLTLVMQRKPDCALSLLVSAGLDSVAVRVPAHPFAQQLLQASQLPLAAPSANRSGKISPTLARHVEEELGSKVAMILDGGPCEVGLESTVVDATGHTPVILRQGAVTADMIAQLCGRVAEAKAGDAITSPGMLAKHYAPNAQLRLNATALNEGEGLLAFGAPVAGSPVAMQNLSASASVTEAAANLFRMLRQLDAECEHIAVMPIPDEGIGRAINDRLQRAANT